MRQRQPQPEKWLQSRVDEKAIRKSEKHGAINSEREKLEGKKFLSSGTCFRVVHCFGCWRTFALFIFNLVSLSQHSSSSPSSATRHTEHLACGEHLVHVGSQVSQLVNLISLPLLPLGACCWMHYCVKKRRRRRWVEQTMFCDFQICFKL